MTKSRGREKERDSARVQATSVNRSRSSKSVCTESVVTCMHPHAKAAVSCRRVGGRYSRPQETAHHGNNRHQTTTTQNQTRPLRGKFVLFAFEEILLLLRRFNFLATILFVMQVNVILLVYRTYLFLSAYLPRFSLQDRFVFVKAVELIFTQTRVESLTTFRGSVHGG